MNYRKGDVVSLQGVVKHDFNPDETDADKRVFVDIIGSHDTVWIKPDDLTMMQPRFDIGETVVWDGGIDIGTILAIQDGHAWIGVVDGDYRTIPLASLKRAPDTSKDDVV